MSSPEMSSLEMNNLEKAMAYFQGISSQDPVLATRYMDAARYVEHNPNARDGVAGVKEFVLQIGADAADLKVIRAYRDGPYVVIQADGQINGDGTFFDVFLFENGLIIEHWAFAARSGPPNKSGHTQIDGPTEARHEEDTEKNKSLVRDYYQTFHIEGRHDALARYFAGDLCVRHEPGVSDGVSAFLSDLEVLTRDRTIDEIKLLLGQGDFVFLAAQGTHQGNPCLYIDLYRVEEGKIVEHWGFPQGVPPSEERRNGNGVL